MVKKFFSHYAPRPLQQPQMPNMEEVECSVCYNISHPSLLSSPPQQFCREPPSLYKPTTQSPSFHKPRHTIQTHASPPPPILTGNQIAAWVLWGWCASSGVWVRIIFLCAHVMRKQTIISPTLSPKICRNSVVQNPSSRCQTIASVRIKLGSDLTTIMRDARPYRFTLFLIL